MSYVIHLLCSRIPLYPPCSAIGAGHFSNNQGSSHNFLGSDNPQDSWTHPKDINSQFFLLSGAQRGCTRWYSSDWAWRWQQWLGVVVVDLHLLFLAFHDRKLAAGQVSSSIVYWASSGQWSSLAFRGPGGPCFKGCLYLPSKNYITYFSYQKPEILLFLRPPHFIL